MMRDSVSVKLRWALSSGTPRVLTTFGLGLFASRLRLGFQRRHGFPYLLQPTLSKGQLLRQLISTLVFADRRLLFLPVDLLLKTLLSCPGPIAGDVELQDGRVVDDPVNGSCSGHRVGEDLLPL